MSPGRRELQVLGTCAGELAETEEVPVERYTLCRSRPVVNSGVVYLVWTVRMAFGLPQPACLNGIVSSVIAFRSRAGESWSREIS